MFNFFKTFRSIVRERVLTLQLIIQYWTNKKKFNKHFNFDIVIRTQMHKRLVMHVCCVCRSVNVRIWKCVEKHYNYNRKRNISMWLAYKFLFIALRISSSVYVGSVTVIGRVTLLYSLIFAYICILFNFSKFIDRSVFQMS